MKFKTHYNLTPEDYRASRSGHFADRRVDLVCGALGRAPAAGRILEIGCGAGDVLAAIARRFPGADCWGVDIDEGLVALAKESLATTNVQFLHADVTKDLGVPRPIDFVYSIDVIHHFHDHAGTFRSIHELVHPDAIWLAIEPNIWHPYVTFNQERMIRSGFDEGHFQPWRMKPLLRNAGFEVRDVTFAHIFPAAVKSVPRWLARVEQTVERTPLIGASAVYTLVAI